MLLSEYNVYFSYPGPFLSQKKYMYHIVMVWEVIASISLCFSRDRQGVKFMLCCQPQLPQQLYSILNEEFAFIYLQSKTMTIPDLQGTEEYHAFFSYSSSGAEDEKKYEALFEFLEDRGLRVNFHRRDFLAQQTILENIHSAVESSRRVIVFWSKAYLKSHYVKLEADAIEEKIRKGNMNIAIHVLVDLSLEEVPKDVRRYTCLMYGDKEFRNQLLSNVTCEYSAKQGLSQDFKNACTKRQFRNFRPSRFSY